MRWKSVLAAVGVLALMDTAASGADLPGTFLRGSISPSYVRWDGWVAGVQGGYSNLTADFTGSNATVGLPQKTTSGGSFGAVIGYNVQWDALVVGLDGAYNHLSSFEATTSGAAGGGNTAISTFELLDYATFRARAGYAFKQFLPYAFVGAAVGRVNYATDVNGVLVAGRDNAFTAGFVTGLGIDVLLWKDVFLRGEYEYVAFSSVGGIRSQLNTGRAAIGVRF